MTVNIYCGKVNSLGGSKISLLNIIGFLHNEKINFNVYVHSQGEFTKKLQQLKVPYKIISEPASISRINNKTKKVTMLFYVLIAIPSLIKNWRKIVHESSYDDIFLINEPRDIILFFPALLLGRRNIQWIRSEEVGFIQKILIKRASEVIAVSEQVSDNARDKFNIQTTVIHNFMLNKPRFVKKEIKRKINIAVVGTIQPIKGQLDAVEILKLLRENHQKDIHLHIVGRVIDKDYKQKIDKYIENNKLSDCVLFINHVDNVTSYLTENVDLTLIPSQTESFCRVAMESLSVGRPVIAYAVGGLKEVINNRETGLLIPKDDITQAAFEISRIINEKEIYEQMSVKGRNDWLERFYIAAVNEKLKAVFK